MNQHHIRIYFFQYTFDAIQNIRCNIKQGLALFHNRKVIIRLDPEGIQHLIQHLTMLTGNTDNGFNFGTIFQFIHQGAHFDRFRSCAEDQHDFFIN